MSSVSIAEDPRYIQGRKFLNDKSYEDAINIFTNLLQTCNEEYGDMSLESALPYFEYGNAILSKEEENPSHDVLGNVDKDKDASAESKAMEEDTEENEFEDGKEGEDGDADGEEEEDEPEDDLQIAWEVLDVARCILTKHQDNEANKLLLAKVHIRLGDLMRFNDNVPDSIEEYRKALEIRTKTLQPHDRLISDAHFALAVAHIYNASEKDSGVNPLEEKRLALKQYTMSKNTLSLWLEHNKGASAQDIADVADLIDTLQESIEALDAEISEEAGGTSSSSSSSTAPVTTIGFGFPSGSATSAAAPSTVGKAVAVSASNGSSSSSSSSSSSAAPAPMMLQAKKKRTVESVSGASNSESKAAKTK